MRNILRFTAFSFVSLLILWYVYWDMDWEGLRDAFIRDIQSYTWIVISMLGSLVAHWSRAMRWGILIEPLGHRPKKRNLVAAVMTMYVMNSVFPRLGEASRCGILKKYDNVPFSQLVGTVVAERVVDLLCMVVLLVLGVLFNLDTVFGYFEANPDNALMEGGGIFSSVWFYLVLGLSIAFLVLLRSRKNAGGLWSRINSTFTQFGKGLRTVTRLKNKRGFWIHSAFIWLIYLLMFYVAFFSMKDLSSFSITIGLFVFAVGSLGMVVPTPQGMGAWHFLVIEAFCLFGEDTESYKVFALFFHESMLIFTLLIGCLCMAALPWLNRKR